MPEKKCQRTEKKVKEKESLPLHPFLKKDKEKEERREERRDDRRDDDKTKTTTFLARKQSSHAQAFSTCARITFLAREVHSPPRVCALAAPPRECALRFCRKVATIHLQKPRRPSRKATAFLPSEAEPCALPSSTLHSSYEYKRPSQVISLPLPSALAEPCRSR